MVTFTELAPAASDPPEPFTDQLRLAVAAYLARLRGSSREHTDSDLRCYLSWCAERGLDPLAARRPHLELYIRWMQEIRRFKPSTMSRRFSVVAGFYRTCVIDDLIEHSPAEHVRRPAVPAESPTLGFTHLQFEALLTAARESPNPCDFALVAMLGLLGLRIFEATSTDISDLGEEHGHRVLRVCGKGSKVVQVPLPPAVSRAIDRATGIRDRGPILLNRRGARMDRHAATRRLRHLAQASGLRAKIHPHMLRHTFVTTMQGRGVASDATFRVRREDGAVRGGCPGTAGRRSRRQGEPAGQDSRDRTVLRQMPGCCVHPGCIRRKHDAAKATKKRSDDGRCHYRPLVTLTHSAGLVIRSLPVLMPAWTSGTSRLPPAMPIRAPQCATTGLGPTWTGTRTTSWPLTCPQQPDQPRVSAAQARGDALHCRIAGVAHARVLCTAMHTHSRFARPYRPSRAAFSTVPVGIQIAEYLRLTLWPPEPHLRADVPVLASPY
jgi:integrase/recombinase XerD